MRDLLPVWERHALMRPELVREPIDRGEHCLLPFEDSNAKSNDPQNGALVVSLSENFDFERFRTRIKSIPHAIEVARRLSGLQR